MRRDSELKSGKMPEKESPRSHEMSHTSAESQDFEIETLSATRRGNGLMQLLRNNLFVVLMCGSLVIASLGLAGG